MAKTAITKEPRPFLMSQQFTGYLDEMPQEAKDKMKVEKPESYKMVFGDKEPEPEKVQE